MSSRTTTYNRVKFAVVVSKATESCVLKAINETYNTNLCPCRQSLARPEPTGVDVVIRWM